VGSSILGSGTSSTLTLRLPCHLTAFMRRLYPRRARANKRTGRFTIPPSVALTV
jgi:hypothetical protein